MLMSDEIPADIKEMRREVKAIKYTSLSPEIKS